MSFWNPCFYGSEENPIVQFGVDMSGSVVYWPQPLRPSYPYIYRSDQNPIVESGGDMSGSILYRPKPLRITDVGSWKLSSLVGNPEANTNMVQVPYPPSAPPSNYIPERNIPTPSEPFSLFGQHIELPMSMDMDCDSGTVNEHNLAVAATPAPLAVNISQTNRIKIFPETVKKMLLTGIFERIPVKYRSWARDKELRGLITGVGFLCGCNNCNFKNVVTAKEFETHAGCKTKHPNNNIYFANGKSLFEVAQELRNTPRDCLFEVISNVAGCRVNQQNFSKWKDTFQAE